MPDSEVLQLATAAATAVASAMATDAWKAARAGLAHLFGHGNSDERVAIEAQLDRNNAQVERASDAVEVRRRLSESWRLELQTMLEESPELAQELQLLVATIEGELPDQQRAQIQHITQRVQIDGSGNMTNVVAGGNVFNHGLGAQPRE